jgi:hypothetical protein
MEALALEFLFDDLPAGRFEGPEYPRSPGRYRYEPYRGPGHYLMHIRRKAEGAARCDYDFDALRMFFTVKDSPEHGVLALLDFQAVPRTGS